MRIHVLLSWLREVLSTVGPTAVVHDSPERNYDNVSQEDEEYQYINRNLKSVENLFKKNLKVRKDKLSVASKQRLNEFRRSIDVGIIF